MVDGVGNGIKDAIWRGDGKLLEMGLHMPSKILLAGMEEVSE